MTPQQQKQRGHWLISAVRKRRQKRALELIRQGADLSVCGPAGESVLFSAVDYGCDTLLEPLLEAGADPNVPGPRGSYPLHLAVGSWDPHAACRVETLLRHGARVDVRNDKGATPIFEAGKSADRDVIHALLRHGANISDRNNELDTALTFACCWGMTERAAMLLQAGIDIHAQDDLGMTALAWAAKDGHASTLALLLIYGAGVDVPDRWGRTPLMRAAAHGSARCVELLLGRSADPQAQDCDGRTALDYTRPYAGRNLEEALLAEITERHCRGIARGEAVSVERTVTPSGEPCVRIEIGNENSAWCLERCDAYDRVVQLLVDRLRMEHPRGRQPEVEQPTFD